MKINRRTMIMKSSMNNALVNGDEILFGKGHNYPKVFTITVLSNGEDIVEAGELNFEIAAYTKEETTLEAF